MSFGLGNKYPDSDNQLLQISEKHSTLSSLVGTCY